MTEDEVLLLPIGSEQICAWCKTYPGCSFLKGPCITIGGFYPFPLTPLQVQMVSQMPKCPVSGERVWNEVKIKAMYPGIKEWRER